MRTGGARATPRRTAFWLVAGLVVVYNANGREIGTVDSQPAKFTAREIAVEHTLVLDRVIAERPLLAERTAFAVDASGHTRSAYPVAPALVASIPAVALHASGLVDMDAPLAPNLVASLTASLLTGGAVGLVFLALLRLVSPPAALWTAVGLGLGTNLWALASQTLWAHESVAFGLALALWSWLRPSSDLVPRRVWLGAAGLVLAGAARPQTAPLVLAFLAWLTVRTGGRRAAGAIALVAVAACLNLGVNMAWFGHLLGALPRLEAVHPAVHAVSGSVGNPIAGALGLLVSPSRGLLVFSPVALLIVAGGAAAWRADRDLGLRLLVAGAAAQGIAYASYAVWWGGHTFGPRYLLDLLVPLAPAAALGVEWALPRRPARITAGLLLVWSIVVAGLGAFVYPNEQWNTRPASVDRNHDRLWDVRDSQILRALASAPSPQNFDLFGAEAVRRAPD